MFGGGDGVSVNMIDGPGPSSVATLVIGTGFDENFGIEECRDIAGRCGDDCGDA